MKFVQGARRRAKGHSREVMQSTGLKIVPARFAWQLAPVAHSQFRLGVSGLMDDMLDWNVSESRYDFTSQAHSSVLRTIRCIAKRS